MANTLLTELCQHKNGRTRAQLLDLLMRKSPYSNPDETKNDLSTVLQILQRDGYLASEDSKYLFRSFLLREYWRMREVA